MHLVMDKGGEHICSFVNQYADGHVTYIYTMYGGQPTSIILWKFDMHVQVCTPPPPPKKKKKKKKVLGK